MIEPLTYADALEHEETRCPVCSAERYLFQRFPRATLSAKARYNCGSSFSTYENHPIRPDLPCTKPSIVAADEINARVEARRGGPS